MSSTIHSQLEECFSLAFPGLEAAGIPDASMETLAEWDSLAMLTLVGVIEETFQVTIALDDLPSLVSFEKLEQYLTVASQQSKAA